jgi:putative PEP-CTERM system TPR-repeat lipoprotein
MLKRMDRGLVHAAAIAVVVLMAACSEKTPEELVRSARDHAAKGDINAAVIQYRNAAAKAPQDGAIRLALGKALMQQHDAIAGEKELKRALELGQPPDEAVPLLARALNQMGRSREVLKEWSATQLTSAEARVALLAELGEANMQAGTVKGAKAAFAAALQERPGYPPALTGLAVAALGEGRTDEARKLAEDAVRSDPQSAPAHAVLGEVHNALGNRDEARAAMRRAIAIDPRFVPARASLIAMALRDGDTKEAKAELAAANRAGARDLRIAYFEAQIAYYDGEYEKVRDATQQLLKASPDYIPARVLAGAAELKLNQPVLAEWHLKRVLAKAPEHEGARRLLASAYLGTGEGRRALDVLQPLLAAKKTPSSEVLALAGEAEFQSGNLQQAARYFDQAAAGNAAGLTRTRLAQIALATGRRDEGLAELEALSSADTSQSQADLALIGAHLRAGELDKALKAAKALEAKQPRNPTTFLMLGTVYQARNDAAAARAAFDKALELQPTFLPAAVALARLDLAEKRDPSASRKRFEAMIEANRKAGRAASNDDVFVALGEFLRASGAPAPEVLAAFQQAVKADPSRAWH